MCLEKTHHKKGAGGVAQSVGPEFKPQTAKKKKKYSTQKQGWQNGSSGRAPA
jgi:hypothetical protein